MKKISETEENEMYKVINNALFSLCEEKPNDPVEFLSRKMLEMIGDNPENLMMKKKIDKKLVKNGTSSDDLIFTNEKIISKHTMVKFSQKYKIIRKIGSGNKGGIVFLAENINYPGQLRAVKVIEKANFEEIQLSDYTKELLLNADHPNICKIFEILEDLDNFYIIMEYCNSGDLFDFMVKRKILNEKMVKNILRQLLSAVSYLHVNNLPHLDIKPENILIVVNSSNANPNTTNSNHTAEMGKTFSINNSYSFESKLEKSDSLDVTIKLTDFGTKKFFIGNKVKMDENELHLFTAPEVIEGKPDFKSDVWSLGIVAYMLLSGFPPFSGKQQAVIYKILHSDFEFKKRHSGQAREFISHLLDRNIETRFTAEDAHHADYLENQHHHHKNNEEHKASDNCHNEETDLEGIEILSNMTKFVMGKNLKRSVLSFMSSKRLFSDSNTAELTKLFNEIDTNHDGTIDAEELYMRYGKYFAGSDEEQWDKVKKFINNVDIDKSGKIEFSEFLTVSSILNKEIHDKMLMDVFKFFDESGNGYIDANDIREIFEDSNFSSQEFQAMIDEFDKNGDRQISFEEFKQMLLS